jgi:glycogen debranching enzyme
MTIQAWSHTFGTQVCGSVSEGGAREWLVPDGLGGYAMGTVCGLRTRRYHGLQVIAGGGPASRRLGLAALDPVLVLPSGARLALGVHEWSSGAVAPAGQEWLESFGLLDGLPYWRWRVGGVVLERTLAMQHGSPGLGVVHRLVAGDAVGLELEALCTWRDAHGERHANGPLPCRHVADGVVVEDAYRVAGPGWRPDGQWYLGVHARAEAERGLPADEDLWFAGRFVTPLQPGQTMEVSACAVIAAAAPDDAIDAALAVAADAFVVGGTAEPDVVAGYPWFGSWSRDTMTSYPGLFLETGRADEGRRLLERYASTISEGMLANTADTGQTEYNTVDATMWSAPATPTWAWRCCRHSTRSWPRT